MIRVTFMADKDAWDDYKAYAKTLGRTGSELLNRHLKTTVDTNRNRIERYKKGMRELIENLDADERGCAE